MALSRVSFTFFGPSAGLEFHTVPDPGLPALCNPPAIASVYEFEQQGTAFMVARESAPETGVPMTWIGSYTQIFEKDLDRRGHSFGVGIWFSSDMPHEAVFVIRALNELKLAFTQRCAYEGRFCDRTEFLDFVKYFEPKFSSFREKMFPRWEVAKYGTGLSINSDQAAFQVVPNMKDEGTLSRLLAWCIWAPGATPFQKIVLAEGGAGKPSKSLKKVDDLEKTSGDIYLDVLGKYRGLNEKRNAEVAKLGGELDQCELARIDLKRKNEQLEININSLKYKFEQARSALPAREVVLADNSRVMGPLVVRIEAALSDFRRDLDKKYESQGDSWMIVTLLAFILLLFILGVGLYSGYKSWNFDVASLVTQSQMRVTEENIIKLIQAQRSAQDKNELEKELDNQKVTSPPKNIKPISSPKGVDEGVTKKPTNPLQVNKPPARGGDEK